MISEIRGNLIDLALEGKFDIITHGVNCFCTMGAGIAVLMKENFECDKFPLEHPSLKGEINKLGCIDYQTKSILTKKSILVPDFGSKDLIVINSYTQYRYGRNHSDGDKLPVDYDAIRMCMKKINFLFKGKHIGLPKIGAGLAGGNWCMIKKIIEEELKDMRVTIVLYKESYKM